MIAAVDVAILRLRPTLSAPFLVAYLTSARHLAYADLMARGTIMQRLARSQVGDMAIPLPDLAIQLRVADQVERQTGQLATAQGALSSQIQLLQELRQALVTAAVTGELEIPGMAA